MADPVNILPDPGFEGSLVNWDVSDPAIASLSASAAVVFGGTQSLQMDYAAAGQSSAQTLVGGLVVGRFYRVQAWFFCPQGSGGLVPTIQIDWPDEWQTAPNVWSNHAEIWASYTGPVMASTVPIQEGVWTLREMVFAALYSSATIQLFNFLPASAGQSFNVDDMTVSFDVPKLPNVYCELAGEWTTVPVMNIIGQDFGMGMLTYREVQTFEPDRITPITPATYTGVMADYVSYIDIMSNANSVTKVTRVETDGSTQTLQYSMPLPIEHGGFRLIDIEAPLDTAFHYQVTLNTGVVMETLECSIPTSSIAPDITMHCVPALLSDPLSGTLSLWVGLVSIDALSHSGRRELFEVISRHYPVAISDVRSTARTQIRVVTFTLAERSKMLDVLGTGRVLLLRIPDESYPEAYWYISVGDLTEERIMRDHRRPERRWVMEVAVVERPYGLVTFDSNRDYLEVMNFEPDGVTPITPQSYQGAIFDYPDYLAMLIGTSPASPTVSTAVTSGAEFWPAASSTTSPWVLTP